MPRAGIEQPVDIRIDSLSLPGVLGLPKGTKSLVIFAHGSGSSRLSPRNTFVAHTLHEAGMGTLLFDLLTEEEDLVYETRFNIDLIAARLARTTVWVSNNSETRNLVKGYFGASTGAAAALKAAANLETEIRAVVSRGGRPDLVLDVLHKVHAPTLLIVGERDTTVLGVNRKAYEKLNQPKELSIVAGATHLFEEPGALEKAAHLAADWFKKYLTP